MLDCIAVKKLGVYCTEMIAASENQTHKKDYWESELRSLGIEPKRRGNPTIRMS